jgi:misacylated tRNA(Ala) deacylase
MKSYDPQMHSAEHILNQTMVRMFGCERSYSSHIEKKKSKCDYHFDRSLSSEEEKELSERINLVIDRKLDVTEKLISLVEAEQAYNLKRLPEESGDLIRIVSVGDYDECPCIGPHVGNTSEIGQFQLVSSSFEDGVLRVRFKLNKP